MSIGFLHTNFSRGQLSTKVQTRIDTQSYVDGAKVIENALVQLQGGARPRPGMISRKRLEVAGVPITADGARIETFMVDRSEVYILAFTAARLDIYRLTAGDITLAQSATSMPWTASTMKFMTVASQGAITVITDETFKPKVITRTALDTFTVADIAFQDRRDGKRVYEPYHKYADFDLTLTLSGVADAWSVGTGRTLTASASLFDDDHVGKRFLMRGGEVEITSKSSDTVCTVEVIREIRTILDPDPFACHGGSTEITVTWVDHGLSAGDTVNFARSGDSTEAVGANDVNGDQTVLEVLNEDQFTFDHGLTNATGGVDFGGSDVWARTAGATRDWQEPAFSIYRGWPQAVCFDEARMWLAGPPNAGTARWGSRAASYFSFDLGDGDPADAVKAVGDAGGNIRHMVSGADLEVFSDNREAYMPSGLDEGINQANVREKKQSRYGAAFTPPIRFDGATLFVDAVGQHVREFIYDAENTRTYTAAPVTALADDIITAPFDSCVYEGAAVDATPYAIYVNTDGSAAFLHSARQEGVAGWTKQTTNGTFLSFTGAGERLFCAVTRGTEMFIEEWDFDFIARADGCENLTAASTTSWTATLAHLKSATVEVFRSDGTWLEQVTTDAAGAFTTSTSETDIYVGLDAAWTLETLPPALGMANGPILGSRNLLNPIIVFLTATDRVKVGRTTKTFATPATGVYEFRGDGWKRDPTVPLTGTISRRATIPGIRVEVF